MAAVVLPLPGPVFTMMRPRRMSFMCFRRRFHRGDSEPRRTKMISTSMPPLCLRCGSVGPCEHRDLGRILAGIHALAVSDELVQRDATDGGLGLVLDLFLVLTRSGPVAACEAFLDGLLQLVVVFHFEGVFFAK